MYNVNKLKLPIIGVITVMQIAAAKRWQFLLYLRIISTRLPMFEEFLIYTVFKECEFMETGGSNASSGGRSTKEKSDVPLCLNSHSGIL